MTTKKRNLKIKKIIATLLLVSLVSVSPLSAFQAHAWDAIPAAIVKQALEMMNTQIQAMIRSLLKTMAATLINTMMTRLVSGGAGGPKFITNWENYIVTKSGEKADSYANAYIDQAIQGRGSNASYRPTANSEGIARGTYNRGYTSNASYSQIVADEVQDNVITRRIKKMDYTGILKDMYKGGTSKEMSQLAESQNTVAGQTIYGESIRLQSLENERDVAMAKSIAGQGFPGTEKNGQTVTPGITTKDALSNSQNIGNLIVATAKDIPEVLTGLATKLVMQAITNGIGNIATRLQKEVTDVNLKSTQALNAARANSTYRR